MLMLMRRKIKSKLVLKNNDDEKKTICVIFYDFQPTGSTRIYIGCNFPMHPNSPKHQPMQIQFLPVGRKSQILTHMEKGEMALVTGQNGKGRNENNYY